MYFATLQQFAKTLKNLETIIGKAIKSAETRGFDPNNFCTSRLSPDMFPFTRQVQIACDVAKYAAASLAGKDAPKHEDNEKTLTELQARIRKVLGYLETFTVDDFKQVNSRTVVRMAFPQGKAMHAEEFLLSRAVPNFFFHLTTAYALLRAGGVDIGKGDYLGSLNMFDA